MRLRRPHNARSTSHPEPCMNLSIHIVDPRSVGSQSMESFGDTLVGGLSAAFVRQADYRDVSSPSSLSTSRTKDAAFVTGIIQVRDGAVRLIGVSNIFGLKLFNHLWCQFDFEWHSCL